MRRRTVIAGIPAALLFSGCTDLIRGDEARFEADTAVVADDVVADSGYEKVEVTDDEIRKDFDQVDRTVVVINSMAEYARSVNIGPLGGELARFTVLATPKIDLVPGRPANPVGDMDDREIAEMVQSEYDDIDNVELVDTREGQLLGDTVEISKFAADAKTVGGEDVSVYMHIGQTDNEDDFVIVVGVHPRDVDDQDEIDALVGGVEHPA